MTTVEVQLHSFLTLALDQGESLNSRPGHCSPRNETRYQLNMRLGGPQSWYEHSGLKKSFPLPKFEPRTEQSVT